MAKWEESEEEEDLEGVVWAEDGFGGFEGLADFKEVLIFTRILRACERENGVKMWEKVCQDWFFFFPFPFLFFFFLPFLGNGIMNVGSEVGEM